MSTRSPIPDVKYLMPQGLRPPLAVEPGRNGPPVPHNAVDSGQNPHESVCEPRLLGHADPADMTPHQRLAELAGLLAAGYRRSQRRLRGLDPAASRVPSQHQDPGPAALELPASPATHGSPVVDAGRGEVP